MVENIYIYKLCTRSSHMNGLYNNNPKFTHEMYAILCSIEHDRIHPNLTDDWLES